jgi:hypothetical protein
MARRYAAMGWLEPADDRGGAFKASRDSDAGDRCSGSADRAHLSHPAFSQHGSVEVPRADVEAWAMCWNIRCPTDMPRSKPRLTYCRPTADQRRLLALPWRSQPPGRDRIDDVAGSGGPCPCSVKLRPSPELATAQEMWRKSRLRQVLRLALEALFAWTIDRLGVAPRPTSALVQDFLRSPGVAGAQTTRLWLGAAEPGAGPVEHLQALEAALKPRDRADVPPVVRGALAFCIAEAPAAQRRSKRRNVSR